jgi:hypothetical protein
MKPQPSAPVKVALGPAPRATMILDRYTELMKRHDGDADKVEQFLRDLQDLRLTGNR